MICRHCHFTTELLKICPQCQGSYLRSLGTGIEKLESEAARLYPSARVACFDKEKSGLPQNWDILIATQAILRFQDQMKVHLIGVLRFDEELNRFDFRSGQRAFNLLVHLRQWAQEKLVIQTRMMDNYCLKALAQMDFDAFYRKELNLRRELGFPPSRHLVAVGLRGKKEDVMLEESHRLFDQLKERSPRGMEIMEPHPDMVPKLRDQYRWTIMLKGKTLRPLLLTAKRTLKSFKKKSVIITVDGNP